MKSHDEFVFCYRECNYHNRYDGWCHYNGCDVSKVENCKYYKQELKK